jgi:DNA-binding NtrC family response regulator
VMSYTSGNRSAAARILGISRVGLHAKLKRLGLDVEVPATRGGAHPKPEPEG